MRWTGFLVGSLFGVAAAAYVAKTRPGMFAWASSAMWSGMAGRAVEAAVNRKFGTAAQGAQMPGAPMPAASAGKSGEAWGQIQTMVNNDPAVKRETQEIMAEAAKH
jgi:hypothetical protein